MAGSHTPWGSLPCRSWSVHPRERLSAPSLPGGRLEHICRTTHFATHLHRDESGAREGVYTGEWVELPSEKKESQA